jgi:hypothetical protein
MDVFLYYRNTHVCEYIVIIIIRFSYKTDMCTHKSGDIDYFSHVLYITFYNICVANIFVRILFTVNTEMQGGLEVPPSKYQKQKINYLTYKCITNK